MALCLCFAAIASYSATVWSSDVAFDGTPTTDPVVVKPTDTIGYSTAIEDGNGVALSITAIRDKDPLDQTVIVDERRDPSALIEGTENWSYNPNDYTLNEGYVLQERIDTSTTPSQGKTYTRTVKVLPEPAVLMILGFFGLLFFRRYAKKLLVILAVCALGSTMAHAETTVSSVSCLQLWPIHREVVINYTVSSDYSGEGNLTIKFYGSTDEGVTTFDLSTKGTLTKDGASGTITPGTHKTIWTPDSTLNNVTGTIRVGVEVEEPTPPTPSTYMIVDLSEGSSASSYPVSYTDEEPASTWNVDEYKTSKMVFRLIPAGNFTMGSPVGEVGRIGSKEQQHGVTLTKSFYIGVFEVTQEQYKKLTGNYSSSYSGNNKAPAASVTFDSLRGSNEGAKWPTETGIDSTSTLGKLREKTNDLHFDLPTEAQWEYACRAGTATALNSGRNLLYEDDEDPYMDAVGTYDCSRPFGIATVGSYLANAWGLYDMHGNAGEWCLDWWDDENYEATAVTDPPGPDTPKTDPVYGTYCRMYRGGAYNQSAGNCRSASRNHNATAVMYPSNGFRIILVVD